MPDSLEWPDGVAVSIGEIDLRREIDAEDLIFAAPEQLMQTGRLGRGVDSTFQYRLGVLFYKLVLGINPFYLTIDAHYSQFIIGGFLVVQLVNCQLKSMFYFVKKFDVLFIKSHELGY